MSFENCPYNFKSSDPNFCDKCQRCTNQGFSHFMEGKKHIVLQPQRGWLSWKHKKIKRSKKGTSAYSYHFDHIANTGKMVKKNKEAQHGAATLLVCELTDKEVWITNGHCDEQDKCKEPGCLLKESNK